MAEMSKNTRSLLIDGTNKALKSRNLHELHAMQNLLKTKCHQHQMSWLAFLVDEVLPASKGPNLIVEDTFNCPYCKREFSNSTGLKAHLGRQHPDKKAEWSIKI